LIKSHKNNVRGHGFLTGLSVWLFALSFYAVFATYSHAQTDTGSVQVINNSNIVSTPPKTESYLPNPSTDRRVLADSKTLDKKVNPNALDLRQLWNELRSNNPQLIAARETYLAAKATVPQIAAPDNPQVGLIWSGMPVGSAAALGTAGTNPAGNSGYSFAQPFKFPGKKSLAADIADKGAESLQAQNDNLFLQLGSQLATLYYSTLAAQKQLQVLNDTVVRTEMIKNIAKARYSNHAAAYVEYLNAQVAQSAAESDKFNLERQLVVAYKNINVLIGRDPRDKLVLMGDNNSSIGKVPSLIELESYAETSHPILRSSTLQLDAAKKGVTLAKAAYLPDFQVIATSYTPRGPLTSNNGANYYQFEFDIVIPLYFFTKERYGVEQAQRNQAAAQSIDVSLKQQIVLGVGSAYATYEQAKKYSEFLRDRQVPQADAAYRVAITQYANNGQGFTDLLTAQSQLRTFQIQLAIAESNLLQAQAALFASAGKDPIE
jgi:outer membrane protein TolC